MGRGRRCLEYSVPTMTTKSEARKIAIVRGDLSTEVGGVKFESHRHSWIAWVVGPSEHL